MKNPVIPILFIILFVFSCSENKESEKKSTKETAAKEDFTTGKIIENIKCKNDPSLSYDLYLPDEYTSEEKYPVIYLFDPRGLGILPVRAFKASAEKFNYILAGSNDMKNKLNWDQISRIASLLFDDTNTRLSIDERKVYIAGFSGGARAGTSIAARLGGINTVIGMSAGFSKNPINAQHKFDFIGIAGKYDFNYLEMQQLDNTLDDSDYHHQFLYFEGGHKYPDQKTIGDVFIWLEINMMKKGLKPVNKQLITGFTIKHENLIRENRKNKKPIYENYKIYKKMIGYLDGIAQLTEYKRLFEELKDSKHIQQRLQEKQELMQKESDLRNEFMELLQQGKAKVLIDSIKNIDSEVENESVKKRTLNYLSMVSYLLAMNKISSGDFDTAKELIKIYEIVDPDNPDRYFLKACLEAQARNKQESLSYLDDAAENGFFDYKKLENEELLNVIKDKENYENILNKVKKNLDNKYK